jgi:curved DNA-binding protein CbpA
MPNRVIQYPVPLILKKVLADKADGELVVVGNDFTKNLFFLKGNLVFARTNVIEERLGEILFKIGKINRSQFLNITELIKSSNERIGKILVKNNILNQRDLFFALIYQLRTIATSTFTLVSGEWNFIPDTPEVPEDSRFNIGLPGIIAEGTNKIGNIPYFKNKFFYKGLKLYNIPEQMKEFLSGFEVAFYNDLAKFGNMSCEQLLSRLKISEDVFWKKMILFYLLNIVDFVDVVADKERDKNIEHIIRLYDKLKANGMDFYELLGLKNTASQAEIKSMYFDYAKKYHPDRISNAPDPDIKEKSNFVFAEINKAYETLSNPDKRNEYDSKGYKEISHSDTLKENMAEKARALYRKAKSLYAQKQYWEAASFMDEAVQSDPTKASYFLLLGLSQMNLPKLKRTAAANLQKAIDLEPWNVEAYAAMGILFLSENQAKRAEGFFRKVLSFNPDHPLARKKLEEIAGSSSGTSEKKKSMFNIFGKSKK